MNVWKLPVEKAALWFFGIPISLTEVAWTFAMGFYFGIIYKFAAGSGYKQSEKGSYKIFKARESQSANS